MIRSIKSITAFVLLAAVLAPIAAVCIDHDHCCRDLACTDFVNCCCKCQTVSMTPSESLSVSVPNHMHGACVEAVNIVPLSGALPGPDHPPRFAA